MKKKFLLTMLVISMLTLIGGGELSAQNVAKINETGYEYETIQAAVDAAANGQTITLLQNVNISTGTSNYDHVLIKGKTLTIDLNGYIVSANEPEDDVFRIEGIAATGSSAAVGANVTFTSSKNGGTIKHSSCGIISRGENAENVIVLDGVTIDDGGLANHSAIYHNGTNYGCTLTIKNSTISSQLYGLFISGSNSWGDKLNNVRIENSTITSTIDEYQDSDDEGTAVEVKQGNIYVTNSTITANSPMISMSNNASTGGTCSSGYAIALTNNGTNEVSKGECTISGNCEITGAVGIKAGNGGTDPINNNENAEILIYGGTFTTDVTKYLANGYKCENGTVSLTAGGVAQIEGTKYQTLQEAVTAATNGQTIKLLADVNISTGTENYDRVLIKGKTLTIDLNGYKVSANDPEDDVFRIEGIAATGSSAAVGANVTFIDSDEDKKGRIEHSSCGIISRGENAENVIVLDGVTIDDGGDANHSAIYHNGTNFGCNLTIENSTISSQLYGLFISGSTSWGTEKFNTVSIKNSTITSTIDEYQDSADEGTAVEIKRGNLTVENSIITANSPMINMSNNGNGTCSSGFAIALTNNGNEPSTGEINIVSGTFEGAIGIKGAGGTVIENTETAKISISGGTFSNETLPDGLYTTLLDGYCADGFTLTTNLDGTYGVVPENGVAQIKRGEVIISPSYTTLYDAVVDAEDGDIITLLCNVNGAGIVIDKSITIDFDGYTYTFEEPAVGSPGTKTIGFQILQGNDVTLEDGTLQVSINDEDRLAFAMLIQNYANLTITDMTLDGTNLDRYIMMDQYNYSYVLSNNCGNVYVGGNTTIIANPGGDQIGVHGPEVHHGVAFDVCTYATYTPPVVTVNTTGNITGVVEVSAELNLELVGDGSDITIDMSGDGELYHNIGGIKGTSTKSVKGTEDGWGTISSPMGTVQHSAVSGLITGITHDLYRYNETNYTWENVRYDNNNFKTLDAGRGYLYANTADTDVIFSGTYNVNNTDVNLSYTEGAGSLAGFNMVGNPFAHDIDHTHFMTRNGATLANGFYVMDASGAWVAKTGDAKIGAMESVFVKTDIENKLTIYKDALVSKSRGENNGMLEINVANAKYNDVAYVSFNKGLGLDKIAHRNNEIPMVYVPVDGTDYAIAMMNKDVTEIPVSFMAMTMGEYTFSAKAIDCEFEQMYLVDRMTGVETNLLLEDYTFMAKSGDNAERFIIRMENSANANTNTENFVFVNNDELIFNNIAGEGIIRIIDVLGRPVAEYNVYGSANISTTSFRSGVYMIQMSDENGVKVQKVIVD